MKDFSDAAFAPEVIESMTTALDQAVATLPEPVSSAHVNMLAEAILRAAKEGEQDPLVLATRTATRAAGLNRRGGGDAR